MTAATTGATNIITTVIAGSIETTVVERYNIVAPAQGVNCQRMAIDGAHPLPVAWQRLLVQSIRELRPRDAQANIFPLILIYDKSGNLCKRWQVGFSDSACHAPANKDAVIAICTTATMVAVQAKHCTALALKMISEASSNPAFCWPAANARVTMRGAVSAR